MNTKHNLSASKPASWKPVIVLLLLTPLLTELLTQNIPAHKIFKPQLFLTLVFLVYGPVLLLRELAVRWRLGVAGYIILGLVYGVYNEGLLAKTIFQTQLPEPSFNNYGAWWGINFSWGIIIIIFHAFYAFLFPVLIVNYFFPLTARKPWLDKRLWLFITAGVLAYNSWNFLSNMYQPVTLWHFVFLIFMMIGLVLLSKFFQNDEMFERRKMKLWPVVVYGICFVIATFPISGMIVRSSIGAAVYIIYMLAVLCIILIVLHGRSAVHSLLVFCLTAEIGFAACTLWVAKVKDSVKGMETAGLFIIIFLFGLIYVLRKERKSVGKTFQDAS